MTYEERRDAYILDLKKMLYDLQIQYEQAAEPILRRLRDLEERKTAGFSIVLDNTMPPDEIRIISARPEDAT